MHLHSHNREAFDCKPIGNAMSAQLLVADSLSTQSLAAVQSKSGETRTATARDVAPPQAEGKAAETLSLAERIERMDSAMTAVQLAELLNVSKITIFKQAKAGRIPSFRIGTCVRFDPQAVATWLRKM